MQVRLLILSWILASFAGAQTLAIQRVTVIDATGKPAQPELTVVIEHGRIASISPWKKARVPKDAEIVDGTGKFLIPGLWDMHVHGTATAWSYPLYVANGVLGVREMWGPRNANQWLVRSPIWCCWTRTHSLTSTTRAPSKRSCSTANS
jgi:cytosine/adenosine deaminase-related metal-dependent hydrolase